MDAERQAILSWICPSEIDYTDQQYELTRKRQPGIGQWFLDSQHFQNWLHDSDTILMGIGMPGVGKTMITSLVVSHVLEKYKDESGIGLAYIYCQFARHQEQTPEYLMSSILRQLVGRQSIIPDIVKSLYRSARGNRCPRPEEMSDLLETVISSFTRSIIVVDALDELTSHNGVRDKFVSKLLAICKKFEVKIFMTSRVPIKGASGTRSSTERAICALEDDMRRSIRIKLEDGNLFCGKVDLQEKVTSKILRAANGVYLIAMLYAEHLSLFEEPGELLDALDEIDHTSDPYKTVYEQTMRRITSDNNPKNKRNLALTILCYSFLAKRPLRVDELSHALAIKAGSTSFDKNRILDVSEAITRSCAGLVVLDKTNNTVKMFHKTLYDYLVEYHTKWFPDGEKSFGMTCVGYLSLDDFADGPCPEVDPSSLSSESLDDFADGSCSEVDSSSLSSKSLDDFADGPYLKVDPGRNGEFKTIDRYGVWSKVQAQDKSTLLRKRFVQYPFYEYAAQHWHEHIRGSDSETTDVVLRFLADGKKVSASRQAFDCTTSIETTGIQVAARFSLERSLVHCLQHHRLPLHYVNARDQYGRTILSYAAEMNSMEAVRLLVDAGADPNMESEAREFEGFTPLLYAAHRGHEDTVTVLLDSGADVNSKDRLAQNALAHASHSKSQAVARILLERGCDPDSEDHLQRNTLLLAAKEGCEGIVKLLLQRGAQVNYKNGSGETPLLLAARCASSEVMALLIAEGAKKTTEVSRAYKEALKHRQRGEAFSSRRLKLLTSEDPSSRSMPDTIAN
ncbi:hypothetical protein D6C76_07864 [Aureobasidium pullulans]|nr:hypothetical protein D6C76_07864 [Aureobasidium pullulans]